MKQIETTNSTDYKHLYEEQPAICGCAKLPAGQIPMSNARYEYTANLQYKVKSLSHRVREFETGEKYTSMKADFKIQLAEKDKEIQNLKAELAAANSQIITVRKNWSEIFDDLEKEHAKALTKKDREIETAEKRALNAERQRDEAKDKLRDKMIELYTALTELEDARGRNLKLTAQLNRDHENSSISSSMKANRKKIQNSREKTGRNQGAQPGHKGHGRKWREPTKRIAIPTPAEYMFNPDYILTGKIITRQVVNICLNVIVDEYSTPEYINVHTKRRVHAPFPEGVVNDVNYGGSIKAFAYLLNNHCNVSIANVSNFLADLTGEDLRISQGMINNLAKEFSDKAEQEQRKLFADIQSSPTMGVDFTSVNVNGKKSQVLVCAAPVGIMFSARYAKGHKGVEGSPVEDYQGTLIHDHDRTFYKYGIAHQECLQHVLRYLLDSMNNEANLTWSKQMRKLIREMIHFRKGLPDDGKNPDEAYPEQVKDFEKRFDEILDLAEKEYEYEPPTKYYVEGVNLFKRLRKYRDNHLLFLHDRRVPHTNNHSERPLRKIKRKQKQAMVFRSFESLEYLCNCMSVVETIRLRDENLFEGVAAIFDRGAGYGAEISA